MNFLLRNFFMFLSVSGIILIMFGTDKISTLSKCGLTAVIVLSSVAMCWYDNKMGKLTSKSDGEPTLQTHH